ncbi:hypothetical protein [Vibrio coralliirubri]|uniref:hypothetical protein n=1 Tax=Vibrio coralliirubri TaxID=1516159 RepID=UPI001E5FB995|nr:hypothetical protein [Vibrio coralliirubri]
MVESNCKARQSIQRAIRKYGTQARIYACDNYVLPILFRPPYLGLDDRFNTVRLGAAWSKRVYEGQKVALLSKEMEVIGHAIVESSESGDMTEMLNKHSSHNHMLIGKDSTPQELYDILVRCYGGMFVRSNDILSVINLRRCIES